MELTGNLAKMSTLLEERVQYYLVLSGQKTNLNEIIGRKLTIEYLGEIYCVKCGRKTIKSFSQGYCYPCFVSAPETEECVLRPELCRAHEGIARDLEYAKEHCLIEHFVYLSRTDAIKVGVTRHTQIPIRWIDQGAVEAIKIAVVPNRYMAGLIEVALKQHLPDKTNWRNMLTGKITDNRSLIEVKKLAYDLLTPDLRDFNFKDDIITNIEYPLQAIPLKVSSVDFEKQPVVEGILTGIKGQYLIFDNSKVINIRKFGGYRVKMKF